MKWLTVDLHTELKDKPKVVIIQACQGTKHQNGKITKYSIKIKLNLI